MKVSKEMEDKLLAMPGVTQGKKAVLPGVDSLPFAVEDVSEKEFQQAVLDLAKRNGWKYYHTFDSRRSQPGFPDLVLVRGRVVWMELKSQEGQATAEQLAWVDALKVAGQSAYVFRPSDWQDILNILEGVS